MHQRGTRANLQILLNPGKRNLHIDARSVLCIYMQGTDLQMSLAVTSVSGAKHNENQSDIDRIDGISVTVHVAYYSAQPFLDFFG